MAHKGFLAPSEPPPLLNRDQLLSLAHQGHIPLVLSDHHRQLFDELFAAARTFFGQPESSKSLQYPSPRPEIGYYNVAGEKEYVSLRCSTASGNAALEATSRDAWQKTGALLHRVLADIAKALNINVAAWDPVIDGCMSMPCDGTDVSNQPTVLRIFRYAPATGIADPHVDTGLLTLCVGAGAGLQVYNHPTGSATSVPEISKDESWTDAAGPTLLVGQTLRTLISDKLRCGTHRVVSNPQGRMSIIFALRPCLKHNVDLATLGGPQRSISLRQLHRDIIGTRYNINVAKEVRDEQRQKIKATGTSGRAAPNVTVNSQEAS